MARAPRRPCPASTAARAHRRGRSIVVGALVATILSWSAGCGALVRSAQGQSWTDKLTTTPSLVQTDFGRFGNRLPFNGEISCGETAIAMSLLWLGENGFTQVAPATPTEADALALARIFTGMAEGLVGPLTVDGADLEAGGVLEGHGTVNGPATIYGTMRPCATPGILTFLDTAFIQSAVFHWTLTALDDNPARRGEAWNALDFRQAGTFGTAFDDGGVFVLLNFQGIPDPDGDHPFWKRPHQWVIAQFSPAFKDQNVFWWAAGNLTYWSGTFQPDMVGNQAVLQYAPN